MGFYDIHQYDEVDETVIPMGTVKEFNAYAKQNGEQIITDLEENEPLFAFYG